jgi:diguanylate cyclase (GGDEF)-like protein
MSMDPNSIRWDDEPARGGASVDEIIWDDAPVGQAFSADEIIWDDAPSTGADYDLRSALADRSWGEALLDRGLGIGAAGLEMAGSLVDVANQRTPWDDTPGGAPAFAALETVAGAMNAGRSWLPDWVTRRADATRGYLASQRAADPQNLAPRSEFAEAFADQIDARASAAREAQSTKEHQTRARLAEASKEGFLPALAELATNPSALASASDSLVPALAAGGGVGKVVGRLAGVGAAGETTAQLGTLAAIEGAGAGDGAYRAVMEADAETLAVDPLFAELLEQTEGDAERAREVMAQMARSVATTTGTGASLLLQGLSQRLGFNVAENTVLGQVTRGQTSSRAANAALGGAKEFAGESAEGAASQLAQNLGVMSGGAESDLLRGVPGAAALEGAAGFTAGSVTGAAQSPRRTARKSAASDAAESGPGPLARALQAGESNATPAGDQSSTVATSETIEDDAPFLITRPMRDALRAAGFSRGAIARMRPADAHAVLNPTNSESADTAPGGLRDAIAAPTTATAVEAAPRSGAQAGSIIDRRLAALDAQAQSGRLAPEEARALAEEDAELERLLRAQDRAKADGVRLSPENALTDEERTFADQRRVEIRQVLEKHRGAQGHEAQAAALRAKLDRIDSDPELIALSEELSPAAPPSAPAAPPTEAPAVAAAPATPAPARMTAAVRDARIAELNQARATLDEAGKAELLDLAMQDRDQARVMGSGAPIEGVRKFQALAQAERAGTAPPRRVFVDADNFKSLNDRLGHDVGDEAIRTMGQIYAEAFGPDVVFHKGGDEFVIAGNDDAQLRTGMETVRKRLAEEQFYAVDASGAEKVQNGLGISFGIGDSVNAAEQLQYADKRARADAGLRTERSGVDRRTADPGQLGPGAAERRVRAGQDRRAPDTKAVAPAAPQAARHPEAALLLDGAERVSDGVLLRGDPTALRAGLGRIGIRGAFARRGDGIILQGKPLQAFERWQRQQGVPPLRGVESPFAAAPAASERGADTLSLAEAQFSRDAGSGDFEGIPVEVAQRAADEFAAAYRGNIPVEFRVVNTLEDAYGPGATERAGRASGAFHPQRRILVLAAANLRDAGEATRTLRHEILAHYGLNTLPPADKLALLERVARTRPGKGASSPGLRKLWANIEQRYGDVSELTQAEELFALAAEQERTALGKAWDDIVSAVIAALRKVGLIRGAIKVPEIRSTIEAIARGIRAGTAVQRTFPQSDDAQFSRSRIEAPAGDGGGLSGPASEAPAQADPAVDLRNFDYTPLGEKQGLIAKASQDVRDQVAALQAMLRRPANPQSLRERISDTLAAVLRSTMARSRALVKRNPKAPSLRALFDLAMVEAGSSRLVAETVNEAIAARFAIFTNRARNILASNGLERMPLAQNHLLRQTMLGTLQNPPASIKAAADQLRALMDRQREDLVAAGVDVGEVTDVGYLTRMYDNARILSDERGFLSAAETLYRDHEFKREFGEAARGIMYEPGRLAAFLAQAKRGAPTSVALANGLARLRAAIKTYRQGGALTEAKAVEAIVAQMMPAVAQHFAESRAAAWLHSIKTPDVAQYVNGVGPSGAPLTKERVLSGAADSVMAEYLKTDMLDILDTYGRKVAEKIEHAERFGPKGEKLQQLIDGASREGVPKHDLEQAVELVNAALGLKPARINPKVKGALDFLQAWTYLALLAKAPFASLAEPVTFAIRTGQLRHAAAPLVQLYRALSRNQTGRDLEAMAQAIGVNGHRAVEEMLLNRVGGDYAMTPQWSSLLHRFFRANFLTPLTRAQRAYGVGAATGFLRTLAARVRAGTQRSDTQAHLNELGIADHEAFAEWLLAQPGALLDPRGLFDESGRPTPRGQDYMVAVRRVIDQSIQNPSAAHRPAWSNHPAGRLVTGIMSFSYAAYENVIKATLRRSERRSNEGGWTLQKYLDDTKQSAPVLLGAAALVLSQTLVSTIRELLFNASRFEDKDDDEIAEEMLMLGASRSFGFGSFDPVLNYLSGLKYQRSAAEVAAGAGPGLALQSIDAVANLFTERNSENTDTAEFRAARAAYVATIVPAMNALLSRVPLIGGPAIIALSDKRLGDAFASQFGEKPDPRSHLDREFTRAKGDLDKVTADITGRISLLPAEQWAQELESLKAEFPEILAGATLDTYADIPQNRKKGRAGQPKKTATGEPRLKMGAGDIGSVLGEMEGYPYWTMRRGRPVERTTQGVNDRIAALTTAINAIENDRRLTNRDLVHYVQKTGADVEFLPYDDETATPADRDRMLEDLMQMRRDEKRRGLEVLERARDGLPIDRGMATPDRDLSE